MNSNQLYQQLLDCCEDYEIELGKIVLKKDENVLRFYKPYNPEVANYLIYDLITASSRDSSSVDNIEEMKELSKRYIGIRFKTKKLVRNKIENKQINPYGE